MEVFPTGEDLRTCADRLEEVQRHSPNNVCYSRIIRSPPNGVLVILVGALWLCFARDQCIHDQSNKLRLGCRPEFFIQLLANTICK